MRDDYSIETMSLIAFFEKMCTTIDENKQLVFRRRYLNYKKDPYREIAKLFKMKNIDCGTSHETIRKYDSELKTLVKELVVAHNFFEPLRIYTTDKNYIDNNTLNTLFLENYNTSISDYPSLIKLIMSSIKFFSIKFNEKIDTKRINTIWFRKKAINAAEENFVKEFIVEIVGFLQKQYHSVQIEDICIGIKNPYGFKYNDVMEVIKCLNFVDINQEQYLINPYAHKSLSDIAYRFIIDSPNKTMSLNNLFTQMAKSCTRNFRKRTLQNEIGNDSRIKPISKKSTYTVDENICIDSITTIMKNILKQNGKSINISELFTNVKLIRKDANVKTIQTYLASNNDIFLRLDNGDVILSEWYSDYKSQIKGKRSRIVKNLMDKQVIEFLELKKVAVASELCDYVNYIGKLSSFKKYIKNTGFIDCKIKGKKEYVYSLKENYEKIIEKKLISEYKDANFIIALLKKNDLRMKQVDIVKKLKNKISKNRINYLVTKGEFFNTQKVKIGKKDFNVVELISDIKKLELCLFDSDEVIVIKEIYNAINMIQNNPKMYENMSENDLSEVIKNNLFSALKHHKIVVERELSGGYSCKKNGEIDFYIYKVHDNSIKIISIGENKIYGNKDYRSQMLQDIGYVNQNSGFAFNILVVKDNTGTDYIKATNERDNIVSNFYFENDGTKIYKTRNFSNISKIQVFRDIRNVKVSLHMREDIGQDLKYIHFILHIDRKVNRIAALEARKSK